MKTKQKAKCKYFEQLFGLPSRYGIMCVYPELKDCKELNFNKAHKFERDNHFQNVCCSNTCYKCPNYPILYPNGWLSPEGVFYQCGYENHLYKAYELEQELKIKPRFNTNNNMCHGEELLELIGWIKFYSSPYGDDGHIFGNYTLRKSITGKQIEYMEMIKNNFVGEQLNDYKRLISL